MCTFISKVALVTEDSVEYPCRSLIYDLKSFTFILLCLMFDGVASVAIQFDSTNSDVLAQGDDEDSSFLNFNNISRNRLWNNKFHESNERTRRIR